MGKVLGKWLRGGEISKRAFPPLGEGIYKALKVNRKT